MYVYFLGGCRQGGPVGNGQKELHGFLWNHGPPKVAAFWWAFPSLTLSNWLPYEAFFLAVSWKLDIVASRGNCETILTHLGMAHKNQVSIHWQTWHSGYTAVEIYKYHKWDLSLYNQPQPHPSRQLFGSNDFEDAPHAGLTRPCQRPSVDFRMTVGTVAWESWWFMDVHPPGGWFMVYSR